MRRSNFALRLAPSLFEEARKVTQSEGIAMNQFINLAIAEKLSALRTEVYFQNRSSQSSIPKALRILKFAGLKNPPMHGDEPKNK